jgi:DNA-binding NtrC family response regulator
MPVPDTNSAGIPFRTLVVDDDELVRDLLTEHLRARGMKVTTVANGREAVETLERSAGAFGLVFTDLNLPEADGLAVLRSARAANASAYVVIITGYATLDSAIQAVRLGAYDYLTKPFSLGQIDVILRRVQDRTALEAENRDLLRRIERRDGDPPTGVHERLAAIESRLTAIERLLREMSGGASREA